MPIPLQGALGLNQNLGEQLVQNAPYPFCAEVLGGGLIVHLHYGGACAGTPYQDNLNYFINLGYHVYEDFSSEQMLMMTQKKY